MSKLCLHENKKVVLKASVSFNQCSGRGDCVMMQVEAQASSYEVAPRFSLGYAKQCKVEHDIEKRCLEICFMFGIKGDANRYFPFYSRGAQKR